MPNRKVLFIALIGTLLAVFWQELNQYVLHYPNSKHANLISSADEASYIRPAENLLLKSTWKDSSTGITSYFLRPPGFGLYYLTLKLIFGTKVWLAMKVCQILFFFFSIILISRCLFLLKISNKQNVFFTFLYAVLPCFSGFMYFTITESITPFFTLLSFYFFLKMFNNPEESAVKLSLCAAFLILIRPQLLLFVLLFVLFFILKRRKKQALIMMLAFLPFILWNVRTYAIAGKWMGIHPIYSSTNNSLYRPSHEKMTNLFRIWEHDGAVFHSTISILANDTTNEFLSKALKNVPVKFHRKVKPIFIKFHELKQYQKQNLSHYKRLKSDFKGEKEFYVQVDNAIKSIKDENKVEYYILTPFQSLKKLMLSSHLNLFIFQISFRGNIFMELGRYFSVLLLCTLYLSSFLSLFSKKIKPQQVLAVGIIVSLFYLSFFQRLNEERYLTPIIPLAFLVFISFYAEFSKKLTAYFSKK